MVYHSKGEHLELQRNKTCLKVFVPAIEWEYYPDQLCFKIVLLHIGEFGALRVVTCAEFVRAAPWDD